MNDRQSRALQRLRDDQAVVRAAAGLLRDPAVYGEWAGLDDPHTAELMARVARPRRRQARSPLHVRRDNRIGWPGGGVFGGGH